MKNYQLNIAPLAQHDLKKVPSHIRSRVMAVIFSLATDPFPAKSKEMREPYQTLRRIPVSDWRIIYQIEDDIEFVTVHRIKEKTGPETYENLFEE